MKKNNKFDGEIILAIASLLVAVASLTTAIYNYIH